MTMAEIQAAVVAIMTIVQANGVMAALAVIALAAADMRLTRDAVADLEILNAPRRVQQSDRPIRDP